MTSAILSALSSINYATKDWSDCVRAFQKVVEIVQRTGPFNELYSPMAVSQKLSLGLMQHLQTGVHIYCIDAFRLLIVQQDPAGLARTAQILLQPLLDFLPVSKIQTRKMLLDIVRTIYTRLDRPSFNKLLLPILLSFCSTQISETDPLAVEIVALTMIWMRDPLCFANAMDSLLKIMEFDGGSVLERGNAFLLFTKYLTTELEATAVQTNEGADSSVTLVETSAKVDPRSYITQIKSTASYLLLGNTDQTLLRALFDVLPHLINITDLVLKPVAYRVDDDSVWNIDSEDNTAQIKEWCIDFTFFFACSMKLSSDDAGLRARCHKFLMGSASSFLLNYYAYCMILFFCKMETYLLDSKCKRCTPNNSLRFHTLLPIRLLNVLESLKLQLQDVTAVSELYVDALMCTLPYIVAVSSSPGLSAALSSLFSITQNISVMFYRSLCVTNAHGWPSLTLQFISDPAALEDSPNVKQVGDYYIVPSFTRKHMPNRFSAKLVGSERYFPWVTGSMQASLELTGTVVDTLGDRIYAVGNTAAIVAVELVASLIFEGLALLLDGIKGDKQSTTLARDIFNTASRILSVSVETNDKGLLLQVLTDERHWSNENGVLTNQYNWLAGRVKGDLTMLGISDCCSWSQQDLVPISIIYMLSRVVCTALVEEEDSERRDLYLDILSAECTMGNSIFASPQLDREYNQHFILHVHILLFCILQDFSKFSASLIQFLTSISPDFQERLILLRHALFGLSLPMAIDASLESVEEIAETETMAQRVATYQNAFIETYTNFVEDLPFVFTSTKSPKLQQRDMQPVSGKTDKQIEKLNSFRVYQIVFTVCEELYITASTNSSERSARDSVLGFLSSLIVMQHLPDFAIHYNTFIIERISWGQKLSYDLLFGIFHRCIELHTIPVALDALCYEMVGAISRQDASDAQSACYKIISLLINSYDGAVYLLQAALRLSETVLHTHVSIQCSSKSVHLTDFTIMLTSLIDSGRLIFVLQMLKDLISVFGLRFILNIIKNDKVEGIIVPPLSSSLSRLEDIGSLRETPLEHLVDLLLVLLLETKVFNSVRHSHADDDPLLAVRTTAFQCFECLINTLLKSGLERQDTESYLLHILIKTSCILWQQLIRPIQLSKVLSPLLTDMFLYLLEANVAVYTHLCATGRTVDGTVVRITPFLCNYYKILSVSQKAMVLFMQANPRILSTTVTVLKGINVRYQITVAEAEQFTTMSPVSDISSNIIGISDTPLRALLCDYKYIVEATLLHSTIDKSVSTLDKDWDTLSKEAAKLAAIRKSRSGDKAFLPMPCSVQPLCMLAWLLIYGIRSNYLPEANVIPQLITAVRILIFYNHRKCLQFSDQRAIAYDTQGYYINKEILTIHSGDSNILYIYPQILLIILSLCLKSPSNAKALFEYVLKPLSRYNPHHYALACNLIAEKEKLQSIYYLLLKPFLACDVIASSALLPAKGGICDADYKDTCLSAQSLLLAFFSVHPLNYKLSEQTYPELEHITCRSLREFLGLVAEMKNSNAINLFMTAFKSEVVSLVSEESMQLLIPYTVYLCVIFLLVTQSIDNNSSNGSAVLLSIFSQMNARAFGAIFGETDRVAPDYLSHGIPSSAVFSTTQASLNTTISITANTSTSATRPVSQIAPAHSLSNSPYLAKLLKAITATDSYALFSVGAFMSMDYLTAISQCFVVFFSLLAYVRARVTDTSTEKTVQGVKDILVERANVITELQMKRIMSGARIKSLAPIFNCMTLLVLSASESLGLMDMLQMGPVSSSVIPHLINVNTVVHRQSANKICTALCHQITFLLREMGYFRTPKKVSDAAREFSSQSFSFLATASIVSDSQLISEIVTSTVSAPGALSVSIQTSAFDSILELIGHSTGISLQTVTEKWVKGLMPKKLSLEQCQKVIAVLSSKLGTAMDSITNKDKDILANNLTKVFEDVVSCYIQAKALALLISDTHSKALVSKCSVEVVESILCDNFFNRTKDYIPEDAIFKGSTGKELSNILTIQINIRTGLIPFYARLFLIYECIESIPSSAAASVQHLVLSLLSVTDFYALLLDKTTKQPAWTWFPTHEYMAFITSCISGALNDRFGRLCRIASIPGTPAAPTTRSRVKDILKSSIEQLCAFLALGS